MQDTSHSIRLVNLSSEHIL